jgi:tRNA modification GTPase
MQLEGAFSRQIEEIALRLTESLAEVESRIDFPEEEDIGALPVERLEEFLGESARKLADLAESFHEGRVLREGYRLTIVGRPNVGKSSILNRLLGVDRAIVTPEAGTTRDVIEERVVWRGMPFLLVDTAGVRPARPGSPEHLGAEKSRERARYHAADPSGGVLLVILDVSEPITEEDMEVLNIARDAPHLLIFNKCDLVNYLDRAKLPESWRSEEPIYISALTGKGMSALVDAVVHRRAEGSGAARSEGYLLSSVRHYAAVKRALEAVDRTMAAINENRPHEIIALELRLAREALDEITGTFAVEDVLDIIFSRFCIGK